MKKTIEVLAVLLTAAIVAQAREVTQAEEDDELYEQRADNGIFNHMDVGVNVGTLGVGVEVGVPVGEYVRLRAGYNYMPSFTFHSNFSIDTRGGRYDRFINKVKSIDINSKMAEVGVDLNDPKFSEYKALFDKFYQVELKDNVTMGMKPHLHQFKFLVDVMPFKRNKHWSFTAGFFAGPSDVANAYNLDSERLLLEGVNAYNDLYVRYCQNGIAGNYHDRLTELFWDNGVAGVPLGRFADGKKAMMVPAADGTVRAEMKVSKFRPYVGFGYNTHLSKDRKWNLNVDAGILILCGAPSVYVDNVYKIDDSPIVFDENGNYVSGIGTDEDGNYYGDIIRFNQETWEYEPTGDKLDHVDLVRDLDDIPGKVGSMVNTISKFKVFPNASVTFTYRLY